MLDEPKKATNRHPVVKEGITYLTSKDFMRSLQQTNLLGGQPQKKHQKVRAVLGSLEGGIDPFQNLPTTNHGERRIANCVKYDLGDGWRLVTQQTDKTCVFLFVGDHEDTDRYIENHKGLEFVVRDGVLTKLATVDLVGDGAARWGSKRHDGLLIDMLSEQEWDELLDGLSPRLIRAFGGLDGNVTTERLSNLVAEVPSDRDPQHVDTVMRLLMAGDVDGAKVHIRHKNGSVRKLTDAEMIDVEDGEEIRRIPVGSAEYEGWLKIFLRKSTWQDWFLFLHPQQERVLIADFDGAATLSGVSGSGKTCVVVRRAIRLAQASEARVLLLTLNRSLAGLLTQLIDAACQDDGSRQRIHVKSFFDLAREMLFTFEPANVKCYDDVTWKSEEHIDEVFREYYRCWMNNKDASVLSDIQKSLNARGVCGERYVREEFDWIRSARAPKQRESYLDMARTGRRFGMLEHWRKNLLVGLEGWSAKMRAVGIIDYLGLTEALARHADNIVPTYTNVLIDEAQDFGTTELAIVRRLVPTGPNDVFFCGDVAQTILPKHRSPAEAGFGSIQKMYIRQNYRNSREILTAAYAILKSNLHEDMLDTDDLVILDPNYANFGGPVPMALSTEDLAHEIAYARSYAATRLAQDARSVCIAFAGYTARDIASFAERCGLQALDGSYDPDAQPLVLSDLEETKGYEFDCLIIVNCCDGTLPPRDAPSEESSRSACKLYVAMTRARKELILSFHGTISPWINAVSECIGTDAWNWCENLDESLLRGTPDTMPETEDATQNDPFGSLTGKQFVYTSRALGLSLEAQDAIITCVDGIGLRQANTKIRLKWPSMGALEADLRSKAQQNGLTKTHLPELRRSLGID